MGLLSWRFVVSGSIVYVHGSDGLYPRDTRSASAVANTKN